MNMRFQLRNGGTQKHGGTKEQLLDINFQQTKAITILAKATKLVHYSMLSIQMRFIILYRINQMILSHQGKVTLCFKQAVVTQMK